MTGSHPHTPVLRFGQSTPGSTTNLRRPTSRIDAFFSRLLARVSKDDLPAFDVPEDETPSAVTDNVSERLLVIETPQVDDPANRKWRFSVGQGGPSFSASVEDDAFIDRVLRGVERFGHGDYLMADVRLRQWQSGRGIENEWTIVHVKQHTLGIKVEQAELFPDPESDPESPPMPTDRDVEDTEGP